MPPPGIALVWSFVLSVAIPVAAQSGVDDTEARQRVARAEALFAAGNYEAALPEFAAAHNLLSADARRYFVLHNIAVCHERMFRYDLAVSYYQQYLTSDALSPTERSHVLGTIHTLQGLLATVEIRANVSATVWMDERMVGRAPGTIAIPAGRHLLELRADLHHMCRTQTVTATERARAYGVPFGEYGYGVTAKQ